MTSKHAKTTEKALANLSFLIGVTIWATMFPATEYLLSTWDPVSLAFARLIGGGLILLVAFTMSNDFKAVLREIAWTKIFRCAMYSL